MNLKQSVVPSPSSERKAIELLLLDLDNALEEQEDKLRDLSSIDPNESTKSTPYFSSSQLQGFPSMRIIAFLLKYSSAF